MITFNLKSASCALLLLLAVALIAAPRALQAQTAEPTRPPFSITIGKVEPPKSCSQTDWNIWFDSSVTEFYGYDIWNTVEYYIVQSIDGDPVFGRWYSQAYDRPLETSRTEEMKSFRLTYGGYNPPLWTDSYKAVSELYIAFGDDVVWKLSGSLTCDQGKVGDYSVTSEPLTATRDDVPKFEQNLVLALDDVPLYLHQDGKNKSGYLGTIHACQTFFIGNYRFAYPSIQVLARESLTGHDVLLYDTGHYLPIVDVAEDYGQPGGQPILDQCAAATPETP